MKKMTTTNSFYVDLGVIDCETFNSAYPSVNAYLLSEECGPWAPSRDGNVKEMLDVKTHIHNPYRRCVGGYGRNINVFFLLAEAMWIALGRKDVDWLVLFNKQMAKYSDDGKSFHAPYGYRIRHWGNRSEDEFVGDNYQAAKGYDQLSDAVRLFSENPNTRQVVISIWNPSLDLGFKTKDIPCNDIVMMKIREGRLITTIANRSNDLHLGLPTNIFQFSFLSEVIAGVLGVKLGTQTHNSQSLHVYDWNKSAFTMRDRFVRGGSDEPTLYDFSEAREMDFRFVSELPVNRLVEIDNALRLIIENCTRIAQGGKENPEEIALLKEFSLYLYYSYSLLKCYLNYHLVIDETKDEEIRDAQRLDEIDVIRQMERAYDVEYANLHGLKIEDVKPWDIALLAKNFLAARLSVPLQNDKRERNSILGKL